MASKRIRAALAKVRAYVEDDSHGYEMGSRDWDYGTDCSGLVLLYVAYLLGIDPDALAARYPDWSTRTMRGHLVELGFKVVGFSTSAMDEGRILIKEVAGKVGHTVIYLGDWRIFGAEGNWDGVAGDGDGTEICERKYYSYGYNWIAVPPDTEEEEVTDADIEKIATLAAEKVVNYELNGVKLRDRLIGIDNAANGANNKLADTSDPTGRGKEMTTHDHVKWIGASQQDVLAEIRAAREDIAALKE